MVPHRKRHGIWWMSMPVPVAVALCVTCFFFGFFTHSAPRLGPSLQTQMLDASIRSSRMQQPQQQQQPLQPQVITPQQELAEVAQLEQQQQQQQEQELQHHKEPAAQQQHKKEQQLKEQQQLLLEQQLEQHQKQHREVGRRHKEQLHNHNQQQQQQQQLQEPSEPHEAQEPQPQQQSQPSQQQQQQHLQDTAAPQQPQQPQQQQQQQQQAVEGASVLQEPNHHQQQQQPVGPAGDTADAEKQAVGCMQRAGLLQPLLHPAESGLDHYTVVAYQILSWHPRIVVYPNFIDKAKAAHIINLAQHRVKRSEVKLRQGESLDQGSKTRTSAGVFIQRHEDTDGVLGWLEDKIESVTLIPASYGEPFYALRYQLNEKYDSHMDAFEPDQYSNQKTQRLATMIIYLSEVEEGGETVFKKEGREGDLKRVSNYTTCEDHDYKYKPRLGDAVLFYSLDPDNSINPRSLHGGCPVIKGNKWVITKWLHNRPLQKGGKWVDFAKR